MTIKCPTRGECIHQKEPSDNPLVDTTPHCLLNGSCISPLREYRFTFGQKYAREEHPNFSNAHPDGYVTIWAVEYDTARQIAFQQLGSEWAFQYMPSDLKTWTTLFPQGSLATFRQES